MYLPVEDLSVCAQISAALLRRMHNREDDMRHPRQLPKLVINSVHLQQEMIMIEYGCRSVVFKFGAGLPAAHITLNTWHHSDHSCRLSGESYCAGSNMAKRSGYPRTICHAVGQSNGVNLMCVSETDRRMAVD